MSLMQCKGGGTMCRKERSTATCVYGGEVTCKQVRLVLGECGRCKVRGNILFWENGRCKVCGHIVRCKRVNWDHGQRTNEQPTLTIDHCMMRSFMWSSSAFLQRLQERCSPRGLNADSRVPVDISKC